MRVVMTFLLALLTSVGTWADETVNVGGTDYTLFTGGYTTDGCVIPHNSNTNSSERYTKFVDGSKDNKWCVVNSSSSWSTISIDFHTTTPIIPKGYVLTTGGDTKTYTKRNPKTWKVYAKAEPADEWTEIDSRDITAVPADALPVDDTTDKTYSMTSNTASYKYFRFEVMNIVGKSGNDWTFQLAEMQLFGTAVQDAQHNMRFATVSDLATPYAYTGNPIDIAYTVKDYNDNTLTKGIDYTETISPSTVQEAGKYTLTLTGKGSYSGTKVISFEVRRPIQGSGTAADPYLIGSDLDWKTFADWINKENSTYFNKHYKLTADINVTSTVGTSINNYFGGTFDGDGHTITLDLTSDGDYCAPFRYCGSSTTIKRLRIAGTINTSHEYAAGLVGYLSNGILNIINCWNSVTINSCKDDDYTNLGGFVGFANSTTNIVNCRFDGKLLGASSNGCGGFVGSPSSSKTLTVSNCLFAPTAVTFGANNSSTFVRNLSVSGKITNSYYTEKLGTEQGTAVGTMTNSELQEALGNGWEISSDKVVPVMDIKNLTAGSIICNTFFPYTGSEITVTPTVKDMDGNIIAAENYSVVISPSTVQASGNYTMTVTGNANGYSGTLTHSFRVALQLSGAGTEAEPYTIATTADWNKFAQIVNEGYNYEGEFVKLTADIDNVTTMVGLREDGGDQLLDAPFKGTFDGGYHTLTAAIVSTATGTGVNEQGVAPFHYIKHATIKNLKVAGSITSDSQYAGGLVGWAGSGSSSEKNTITDCVVTATLTIGANSAGGLVGNVQPSGYSSDNYTYFTNCVFAGTIQSSTSEQRTAGGFFGYGSATTYFTNCLENGTYVNLSLMSPRGAYDNYYNKSVTSLYYVNKIGSVSYITEDNGCHQVVTAVPADNIYLTRTINGYTVYQPAILSDLKDVFAYNNGNPVSISYVLKMGNTAMIKDTDYELTIKNSSDVTVAPEDLKEVGTYTIHFTDKAGNKAGYTGEIVRSFQIIVGESLDGYVFATEGEDDDKVYLINDESDLERLAAYVGSGHNTSGLTFKLKADISMKAPHTAIGGNYDNNFRYFRGTFDGNKKTISNLTINKPEVSSQGLFGALGENALVKDVTVDNYYIIGKASVGAIAGYVNASATNRATIQNCHTNGKSVGSVPGAECHGGIIGYGYHYVDITGCTAQGTISATVANNSYGGIIGYADLSVNVTSCENTASITGDGSNHGGIIGYNKNSNNRFTQNLNTGIVEGSEYKGSIAGYSNSYYCYTNNYYADPCTVKALNNNDYSGHGERGYIVTAGSHIASISAAEEGVVESVLTGKNYYNKGDWTLTLTPDQNGVSFVSYACEGGTLTNLTTVDGEHKLSITDQDVTISAIVSNNNGVDMSTVEIAAIPDQRWKGVAIIPELTVTAGGTPLVEGTDYLMDIADNAIVGMATITLTGINGYKGTATKTFNIVDFPLLDPQAANSESNPYLIADEADLQALASIVNSGARTNGYYKQKENITLTKEHTAIGNGSSNFQGNYDGDKKIISGLVINKPNNNYQGLFGYIFNATVRNVVLDNVDITAKEYVGGVVGRSGSSYINTCSVSGAIKTADDVEAKYHGGIVGYMSWYRIEGCVNTATVTGNGTNSQEFGGIAGYMSATTVKDCFNAGEVTGTSYVGSVVGHVYSGTLTTNYHTVSTTGGVGAQNVSTGTDQSGAEIVFAVTAGENTQVTLPETPAKVYNETNYYKNGTEVTLNYNTPADKFFDQYTVSSGSITDPYVIDGKHILTGVTDNVTITGTYTDKMDVASNAVTVHCGIIPYTGDVITVAPVVTRLGVTLVQGTDYTVTTTPAVVQAAGEYTLTITGKGDYTGTKQATFFVKEATIIKNAKEWADFAANVNAGTGNDDYYKLADDFDNTETAVTATVGTQEHPFTGLFDGNGKTLNVNISETSTQGTAPFREIAGATIKNLTVSGSVTGTTYAAGLVGITRSGVNYIENCVVNTNVTCSTGTNRHIGGVVGYGTQSTVNISNTAYTGVLYNSQNYAGGLLGWSDGGKLNITNCLVTASKSGSGKFHPIAVKNTGVEMEVNVNGAFYTNDATLTDDNYIAATGKKVYAGAQEAFCKKEYTFNETGYYSKDATVIGNVANLIEYTGFAITVTPTVTYEGTALTAATDFTFVTNPAIVQEMGEYTLTITGQGNYAGTQTMKFHVVAGVLNGEGTETSPFIIASGADWNNFADNITSGAYNYSGKFVQMTDNITVSTMAGNSEANSFQGTFLGTAGKTMTLNLTGTEDCCAPFGSLKNATIKDLTIAGTVSTGFKFGASIAAHNYGTTHIQNCISTASITSTFETLADGTHGGLVALNDGGAKLYFNDCVFAGKLLGANATSNGGFVGYTNSSIYYTDCLFAPAEITMSTSNSCTFNRNGNNSLTRAYYLTAFSTAQGVIAYTSENVPATGLFGQITAADGNTYYVQGSVSNINDSYAYTGNAISINPTYAISNESVSFVKDADYEVTITKDGNPVTEVKGIGDYVFTFTAKDGGKCKGSYTKNVNVYAAVPTNFICSELTAPTATLTWSDNYAANWTVELSESSDFSSILDTKNVTEKTVTFDGLTVDVDYYARVKAVYGEASSNWSPTIGIQPTTKHVIGSGTSTHTLLPSNNFYNYSLTQQIYTADEMGQAGTVMNIDFYNAGEENRTRKYVVYMVNTTKESFSGSKDWINVTEEGVVKVFEGDVAFAHGQWSTITLDTPFNYDNTKNLAIIIDDNTGSYTSNTPFRVFSATSQAIYVYSDNVNYDPTKPTDYSGSILSVKNQLRIRFATEKMELTDNATDNSATIDANDGKFADVTLKDRTLYKDGEWNTICLPFNVTLAGSPLEGATAKTLIDATNDGSTITLSFGDAVSELVAGTPYIIKWDAAAENLVEPVFSGVIIDKTDNQISLDGGNVKFIGYYDAFPITSANDDIYYMTVGNVLRHTGVARTLNACRAYFKFANPSSAREFVLDFGDSQTTGIMSVDADSKVDNIYDLGGRKMNNNSRLKKGLYIRNGKKTVIK